MREHAVVIAGGGPTGMMLAAELKLAAIDAAIVERRANQELAGSRAGGLHSRSLEVLDQRGIVDRFVSQGTKHPFLHMHPAILAIGDLPTRHNYTLGLWQNHIERILAGWIDELGVPIYREREVAGFTQDDTGVDIQLSGAIGTIGTIGVDIAPWSDRVSLIDAKYAGTWELPAFGAVTAPTAVLIRPDGYVAWVGLADNTEPGPGPGLADALARWFGPGDH